MILKLFKYDCRGVGKKLLPIYLLALGFAVMSRFTFTSYLFNNRLDYMPEIYSMFASLTFMLAIVSVVAVLLVTFFMLVIRYARSVFGEEGYLTNTLPITSSQIIIAKIINYYLWNFVAFVIASICLLIMFFHLDLFMEMWNDILYGMDELLAHFPTEFTPQIVFITLSYIILVFISPISGILLVYVAIGIGSQFKNKFIMSILSYFGLTFLIGQVSNIFIFLFIGIGEKLDSAITEGEAVNIFTTLTAVQLIFVLATTVGYFFLAKYFIDKKLNLE